MDIAAGGLLDGERHGCATASHRLYDDRYAVGSDFAGERRGRILRMGPRDPLRRHAPADSDARGRNMHGRIVAVRRPAILAGRGDVRFLCPLSGRTRGRAGESYRRGGDSVLAHQGFRRHAVGRSDDGRENGARIPATGTTRRLHLPSSALSGTDHRPYRSCAGSLRSFGDDTLGQALRHAGNGGVRRTARRERDMEPRGGDGCRQSFCTG